MLRDLIAKNRTHRRFYEDVTISRAELEDLIDYARLSASGGNKQPLKYILSYEKEMNEHIYATLVWAAYLAEWTEQEQAKSILHTPTGTHLGRKRLWRTLLFVLLAFPASLLLAWLVSSLVLWFKN